MEDCWFYKGSIFFSIARLIKITDCATDLLSLGLTNIYRMTLDDLKKELDD